MPLVAKLMALAIHYEDLLRSEAVGSLTELARLGHVSKTRMSHVMNLLHLAPEIQERPLFLAPVERGRDPVLLRDVQNLARTWEWAQQRRLAKQLFRRAC